MAIHQVLFGRSGCIASLALITADYALFQAATTTAMLTSAVLDQRGVTSALLGLARNLGLMTGRSAVGAVFAAGEQMCFARSAQVRRLA